ncbi:MAG: NAD(+)/NADH kinase [Chloroflexi bacterium]|nr:NAD(+)/NADH kinase [Chloroflexota bacterium]
MTCVGIIANPQSGKDIRRLVAHASVFDNQAKVNIVRRVLVGLDAVGVERALIMPDYFGIGTRALHNLKINLRAELLDMPLENTLDDSTNAARLMREQDVRVIITLGGDGTNRAVAKECGDVPLVAISTGTNNVFPQFIEGTVAGMAAGLVARGVVDENVIHASTRLDILRENEIADVALIDAVVYDAPATGTRAIWEARGIRQIVLTRVEPDRIGLSAIGSALGVALNAHEGLYLETGEGGESVSAPIAPGLIQHISLRVHSKIRIGDSIPVAHAPTAIALDGERTLITRAAHEYHIRLSDAGPRVIDVRAAMAQAAAKGFFIQH